jgi:hypothetical protein
MNHDRLSITLLISLYEVSWYTYVSLSRTNHGFPEDPKVLVPSSNARDSKGSSIDLLFSQFETWTELKIVVEGLKQKENIADSILKSASQQNNPYMSNSAVQDILILRDQQKHLQLRLQQLTNQISHDATALFEEAKADRTGKEHRDSAQFEELKHRIQSLEQKLRDNTRDNEKASKKASQQEADVGQKLKALDDRVESRMDKLDEILTIAMDSTKKIKNKYELLEKKCNEQQAEIQRLQKIKAEDIGTKIQTKVEAILKSQLEKAVKSNATNLSNIILPLLADNMIAQAKGPLSESVLSSSQFSSAVEGLIPKDIINNQFMTAFVDEQVQSASQTIRSDLMKCIDNLTSAIHGVETKITEMNDDVVKQHEQVASMASTANSEKFASEMAFLSKLQKDLSSLPDSEHEVENTGLSTILNKLITELGQLSNQVKENSQQICSNEAQLKEIKQKETLSLAHVAPQIPFNSGNDARPPAPAQRTMSLTQWREVMEKDMSVQNGKLLSLWQACRGNQVKLADLNQRIAILNTQPVVDQMLQRMQELYPILDMERVSQWRKVVDSKINHAQATAEKAMEGQMLLQNFAVILIQWISKIRPMLEQEGDGSSHPGVEKIIFWFKRVEQEMQKAMMMNAANGSGDNNST